MCHSIPVVHALQQAIARGLLRRLIPAIADDDVDLAALVEVGDADPFGAEVVVDDDFFPGDFSETSR